ncbi:mitochondrial import receptor subunit [Grosmannia clavigera kw1407]|uniref:Mitochondrial import receptor subunit TOM20 n=1 Tax=Grosmannia clavigera (strain kw1407 / UAMH 11150) TaxID=655863 RepID=F0XFH8_GROCL|nr:mitochondrial import receptor subunit [Grosmannia clavigera kw1407]EFX03584.1 mitochondrial import receptor subunit [Grosmannia clavigera kw1407]
MPPTSLTTASIAAVATGLVAYALYFDHRRRSQPEFRRVLRRNERQQARAEKEMAHKETAKQREVIKLAVDLAKAEGFPTSVEDKEAFFLDQVSKGETLGTDPTKSIESALHFYKALKVYPTPGDLIRIYDQTVSKPILDILAEMIAFDAELSIRDMAPQPSLGVNDLFPPQASLD